MVALNSSLLCQEGQQGNIKTSFKNHIQHYWPVYAGIGAIIIGTRYAWRTHGWVTNKTFHRNMTLLRTSMEQGFQKTRTDLAATKQMLTHEMCRNTQNLKQHIDGKFSHLEQDLHAKFTKVDDKLKDIEQQKLLAAKEEILERINESEKNIIDHLNNLHAQSTETPHSRFLRYLLHKNPVVIDQKEQEQERLVIEEHNAKKKPFFRWFSKKA